MEETRVNVEMTCPNCGPTTNYDVNSKRCNICGQMVKDRYIIIEEGKEGGGAGPWPPPPPPPPRKMRLCRAHEKEIDADAKYCQYCGIPIPTRDVSETGILGLAAIGGIFGLHGLGHISLGRIGIGFLLLFGGIALLAGIITSAVLYFNWYTPEYIAILCMLAVAYVFLFVWQVMDANNSARRHNENYWNHRAE